MAQDNLQRKAIVFLPSAALISLPEVSQVQPFLLFCQWRLFLSFYIPFPIPLILALTNLNSSALSMKDENLADLHSLLSFLTG